MNISFEELRRIAADVFQVPPKRITPQSSVDTIESWDSLQHLNLILALEQRFGLEFEADEMERMISVNAILTILNEKASERG